MIQRHNGAGGGWFSKNIVRDFFDLVHDFGRFGLNR
jgi:hypothetical protein